MGHLIREHAAADFWKFGRTFVEVSLLPCQKRKICRIESWGAHQLVERNLWTTSVEQEPPCITKNSSASDIEPND